MPRLSRSARSRTDRPGQSLVEFALILPVFVLILVGIFDLGRAVYAYSTINNAAREAGRLAIVDQTSPTGTPTYADIKNLAVQRSVALGLTTADISVDFRDPSTPDTPNSCGTPIIVGCIADVQVNYTFTGSTPLIGQLVGNIPMRGETKFTVEALCVVELPTQPQCPPGS